MFLWLLVVGGALLAVSVFVKPGSALAAVGLLLFVFGLVSFCVVAFRSARRQGTGVGRAAVRVIRASLRLGWEFIP